MPVTSVFQLLGEEMIVEQTGLVAWHAAWAVPGRADCYGAVPNPYGSPFVENIWHREAKVRPSGAGSGYIVNARYEAVINGIVTHWGIYPSFREAKLPTHPQFQAILAKYGGTYDPSTGIITWQQTLPETGGGGLYSAGNGADTSGSSAPSNPLFAADSYVQVAAVFRQVTLRNSITGDALNRIGGIVGSIPVGFPTPSGRNWLVMPAPYEFRGSGIYEDTYEALLSPPGKPWNEDIYDFIQGAGTGGGLFSNQ